ncbi:AAA family ATPase [Acidiphilium multivorum]|uniref:AAA family ATPase n=1 Tax=Acidiphilium multivorum TaxID=62140 RepID=UPI001F4BE57A|nr:AAA family ATPase [Acidiphilium multivorum]UNC14753.1 AAA family ATPase [Acidiphilium multivorum]
MNIMEKSDKVKSKTPIALTFFHSVTGTTAEQVTMSMAQLVERLCGTEAESKHDLPLISGCRFGNLKTGKGSLRHDGNVLAISAIVVEHDSGTITLAEARATMAAARVGGLIYATPSHAPDAPRWRLICPLSSDLPREQHRGLVDRLNAVLNGALAQESWTVSQPYFFGFVSGKPKEWLAVEGGFLDQQVDFEAGGITSNEIQSLAAPVAKTAAELSAFDPEWLRRLIMQTGEHAMREPEWSSTLRALKGAFADRPDLGFDAASHVTAQWTDGVTSPEELAEKWDSQNPRRIGEAEVLRYCGEHGARPDDIGAYVGAAGLARARAAFEADPDMPPPTSLTSTTTSTASRKRFEISRITPLDHSIRQRELIAGWFGLGEFLRLNGSPGCGKTTLAVDWAAHIAGGLPWRGHAVEQGAVLVIELEGAANLQTRVEATCTELGLKQTEIPLFMTADSVSLAVESEWRPLLDAITDTDFGSPLQLVVIDTQARASAGADENSASDTALIVRAIDEIRAKTGAAVLALHHLPHGADRARGSTAFLGAVDCEMIARRDESGVGSIKVVKMRNRADPPPVYYKLKSVPIGLGPDGTIVTGAAAIPAEAPGPQKALKPAAQIALDSLLHEEMAEEQWCGAFVKRYPGSASLDGKRKAFRRAVKELTEAGAVVVADGLARLSGTAGGIAPNWHETLLSPVQ